MCTLNHFLFLATILSVSNTALALTTTNLGFLPSLTLSPEDYSKIAELGNYSGRTWELSPNKDSLICINNSQQKDPSSCDKNIPLYRSKTKFSPTPLVKDLSDQEHPPWLNLDVTNPDQALKLTLIMQKYVYEGWFEQLETKNKENSFEHFKTNSSRTWCSVPWMNVIPNLPSSRLKGRDPIHGLTKEFPIDNSLAYPNIPFKLKPSEPQSELELEHSSQAPWVADKRSYASYGVSYFNRPNCQLISEIFGNESHPKNPKDWLDQRIKANENPSLLKNKFETQDGSVSFKLLFTTLQSQNINLDPSQAAYPMLKNAYRWIGHVATHGSEDIENQRIVQPLHHIQMDIALKDHRLLGLLKGQGLLPSESDQVIPWVMFSYYYDPNYINPIFSKTEPTEVHLSPKEISKMPSGLKHMRPIGIQFGLDRGQSLIFYSDGLSEIGVPLGLALNNHGESPEFVASASSHFMDTRLNGPVDNPKSSCLSCHASAGINAFKRHYDREIVPKIKLDKSETPKEGMIHKTFGVFENQTYKEKVVPHLNTDFNHQIRIGLQRYLEYLKMEKNQ